MSPTAFLLIWAVFTGIALLGIVAVLIWAVRSRQFCDQDSARYLPLKSGIPAEGDACAGEPQGPAPQGSDEPKV
jgi:nitrogen fixation-related uncharacterized protein